MHTVETSDMNYEIQMQVRELDEKEVEDQESALVHIDSKNPEVQKLKLILDKKIKIRQAEKSYMLPEPKCVRHNHNLLAVHCEGKVAEEILDKKCFSMPDGTT